MTRIASTWPLDGGYEWLRTSGAWSPAGTLDTEDPRGP
jgi:hypothetical protein